MAAARVGHDLASPIHRVNQSGEELLSDHLSFMLECRFSWASVTG